MQIFPVGGQEVLHSGPVGSRDNPERMHEPQPIGERHVGALLYVI
jgi:hypothetical protein